MNPSRLGLSRRLALAFAVLTALMLAIAATAVVQMHAMDERRAEITGNWLPSVESVNLMGAHLSELRIVDTLHQHRRGRDAGARKAHGRHPAALRAHPCQL